MRVAIHELKSCLSRYVAQARAGEVIEITSHDKPVARLVGVPATSHGGLGRLMAGGAALWRGGKPVLRAPVELGAQGATVGQIVLEDRR